MSLPLISKVERLRALKAKRKVAAASCDRKSLEELLPHIKSDHWSRPFWNPARFKASYGGRACLSGDTLISTPAGDIPVQEFSGGEVYVFDGHGITTSLALPPIKFDPELLFEVKLSNGETFKATAAHRVLTPKGWQTTRDLSEGSFISTGSHAFSIPCADDTPFLTMPCALQGLPCTSVLTGWLLGVQRYLRRLSGYLYRYSEYCRQCGLPLHGVQGSVVNAIQQLTGVPLHDPPSSGMGEEAFFDKGIYLFLLRLYSSGVLLLQEGKNYALPESHISAISSEFSLLNSLVFQLFQQSTDPALSIPVLATLLLACGTKINQVQTLHKVLPSLKLASFDSPCFMPLGDSLTHHSTLSSVKVESIKPFGVCNFYDFHVPIYENYFGAGGVIHHNSGKSHAFAELMLARMVLDPDLQCVAIRKYRQSLTNSAQLLLRNKVDDLGLGAYFDVQQSRILRRGGRGFIAFQGMQDHNATSIKSFENFGIAWVTEATEIDQRSLDMLIPTLRSQNSQLWFDWNPDQPDDPVDRFFRGDYPPQNAVILPVSFKDNPFLTDTSKEDEERDRLADPEKHAWIWLGEYNLKSDAIVFSGRWEISIVQPTGWDGPYYGADWGFATDPTAAIEVWRNDQTLYVSRESYAHRLELDQTAARWRRDIPGMEQHVIRADSARPESISYVKRQGFPRLIGVEKGKGSVEDGIEWLRSHRILVHPDCVNTIEELKRYRYKQNAAGDVLPQLVDKDNHVIDGIRYALEPLIKGRDNQWLQSPARYGPY